MRKDTVNTDVETVKVNQLLLVAQVLDANPAGFLQQERVIINRDNAALEKGCARVTPMWLLHN